MFGPLGSGGGCHITDMYVWEIGVAPGDAWPAGAAGSVTITVGVLSVQPPSEAI